jgi:uncharacterized membrane protein YagU involved in acid resistance
MALVMTAPRDELHSVTDWSAAAWAGVIAGIVFVMLEMGMVRMFMGESPWAPPHMIAAMALGKDVLPPPGSYAAFDMKIMATAMVIHMILSVVYGLIVGWLVHRFDWTGGLVIGAIFGMAIYIINFYLIAPVMFPWFQMAQNWISAFSHAMFGLAAGGAYIGLRKPKSAKSR